MKIKQLNEIKTKNTQEIKKMTQELSKQIIQARIELGMGNLKNVHSIKSKRKDMAQLKTIIKMKEISEAISNSKNNQTSKNHATD